MTHFSFDENAAFFFSLLLAAFFFSFFLIFGVGIGIKCETGNDGACCCGIGGDNDGSGNDGGGNGSSGNDGGGNDGGRNDGFMENEEDFFLSCSAINSALLGVDKSIAFLDPAANL